MNIPFLDLKTQYNSIKEEVLPAIQNVLENTSFVLGKTVVDFEKRFAEAHQVKHCFAVSSGTDGNHLALWSLGIGPGDEVIIPANTFIATAWGATLNGATPVFVDCDKDNYNINPDKIEAAITKKTKAIVVVHLYGQPADMDRLKTIADENNLYLVEDCAQSHFAEYKGKRTGSFGITASFSFYPGKNLGAYGEGGAVTTNDDKIARKIQMMRDHGAIKKYDHEIYGHNYRMDGIQGAVLGVKMNHIEQWTEARRRNAAKYKRMLADVKEIILPREMPYAKHVYHLFVIQLNNGGVEERDALAAYLNENGVSTGLHYPIPLHLQKCFAHLGYKRGDFPYAEKLAESGLSLPMYAELTNEQIEYVVGKIKEYFAIKKEKIESNVKDAVSSF
ncbi:MAG TPA: DegT/DnrJ/EryC1/StrS family aminotransferase [Ignavibacteriaceae bacterium]|nr:DegT/DnrJ/EryC1/StrS family aminotransferase [Ignavibacteriaceae bacterium]